MEEETISQNGSIISVEPPSITDGEPVNNIMIVKKKRTKFGLLKLAARLFHPASKTHPKQVKEKTKPAKWEKLVGSMRPLHLQQNINSPTRSEATTVTPDGTLSVDNFICSSVASSPSSSSSSMKSNLRSLDSPTSQYNSSVNLRSLDSPTSQYNSSVNLRSLDSPTSQYNSSVNLRSLDSPMSQYYSTNNLQDLVEEDEMDPDEVFDSITGDDMIDSKADEFIAQFYQVMRLERSNRTDIGGRWMV